MEKLHETDIKILLDAYRHYLKTPDAPFVYLIGSEDDVPDSTHALHRLHQRNYIRITSTYTTLDAIAIPISAKSISLFLTADGIAAAQTYWKP